jgi:hypothetical protein
MIWKCGFYGGLAEVSFWGEMAGRWGVRDRAVNRSHAHILASKLT